MRGKKIFANIVLELAGEEYEVQVVGIGKSKTLALSMVHHGVLLSPALETAREQISQVLLGKNLKLQEKQLLW